MRQRIVLLIALFVVPFAAAAHHSFSSEFDTEAYGSLTGIVVEVRFRNPHVQYFMDVAEDGETIRWNLAAQNVASLRRSGINRDTIDVGDEITVTGYFGRDGAKKIYLEVVRTAAGEDIEFFPRDTQRGGKAVVADSVGYDESNIAELLLGHWGFDVDKELPGAPFHLQFQRVDDGLLAILDNEEIPVVIGEDSFMIVLQRENLAGFPATLQLDGKIDGGQISGTVNMTSGYTNFANLHADTFTAVRMTEADWQEKPPAQIQPVDLTGVWTRKIGLGPVGRTNPHLTEAGMARHAEYKKGLYDPTLRCLPSHPMRKYAQPGAVEILATTNRLTMLYANSNTVRRLWFDREQHSDNRPHDTVGEALASWDGSTLVIELRNMTENVLTHNSEPISAEARVVERYSLNEEGNLVMEATLYDPKYYARPVVRRMLMVPSEDRELIYSPCDPDSFYRTLQIDGTLDSYFENQPEPTPP